MIESTIIKYPTEQTREEKKTTKPMKEAGILFLIHFQSSYMHFEKPQPQTLHTTYIHYQTDDIDLISIYIFFSTQRHTNMHWSRPF